MFLPRERCVSPEAEQAAGGGGTAHATRLATANDGRSTTLSASFSNGHRAGARAAAVQEDPGAIRSAALAAAPSLDEGAVDLGVTRDGARGDPVTVSLRYLASIRVPFIDWLFGDSVGMTTTTAARQEFG